MDATATQSVEQADKVPLRVLVDRERNKVLYAEAKKDFVDVLFSFLTLPLGTIARLMAKKSNIEPVRFGSLSSLYQSVSDLDEEHLWTQTCKEMLLQPRNSMEANCQQLKLNIDDTEPMRYFICEDWQCSRKNGGSLLSTFGNQKCSCGKPMNRELSPQECLKFESGFVKETASFIICDDLYVMPNVFATSACLLQKLGVDNNINAMEEQTVDINKKEVVDLLKLSLLSNTPLTDLILKKKHILDNIYPRNQSKFEVEKVVPPDEDTRKMAVKVMVRKSTGEILFAEAEEDFADFLCSFLTFPLGGVLHMLEGFSSLSCMDNLYKSMTELTPDRYLRSQELKDKLAKPQIAPQFQLRKQILPIGAASLPVYYCRACQEVPIYLFHGALTSTTTSHPMIFSNSFGSNRCNEMTVPLSFVDLKFSIQKSLDSGEYAKGPSIYMVTDDLVVTPMSSLSAISYLNSSKIPLIDVEERFVKIGLKEGLSILKASLTSTSALTNGLHRFMKDEK